MRVFVPNGAASTAPAKLGRTFASSSTAVAVDVTGLDAWQPGDSLHVVAPSAELDLANVHEGFATPPAAGTTAIRGQHLDWNAHHAPIVDAAKGDVTWVTQTRDVPTATSHYSRIVKAGVAQGFAVSDGQPATLTTALVPATDVSIELHWKGTAFGAESTHAGPGASPAPAPDIEIKAVPAAIVASDAFEHSYYTDVSSLVALGPISGIADDDESISYSDPYAGSGSAYSEVLTMTYAVSVPVPTPEGIGSVSAMMIAAVPTAQLAGGVVAPTISPVVDPKLDGQPLDHPRTGTGLVPTISWREPATGTATRYAVVVRTVVTSATGVDITPVATIYTTERSITMPCGLLVAGSSYVLTITAIAASDPMPLAGTLPYASADYVTARFTP